MTQLRSEARQDLRTVIVAMIGMAGVIIAFIEYRLPAG